ncbi:hypothetical protein ACSQ67_014608 [Phaseolus vulgaris]
MTTLFAFMLPNRHTYAQAVAKDHRQPFTQATTMENEGRVQGDTKLSSIHFRTEKEDAWRGVEGGSEEKFSKESLESEGSDFG